MTGGRCRADRLRDKNEYRGTQQKRGAASGHAALLYYLVSSLDESIFVVKVSCHFLGGLDIGVSLAFAQI